MVLRVIKFQFLIHDKSNRFGFSRSPTGTNKRSMGLQHLNMLCLHIWLHTWNVASVYYRIRIIWKSIMSLQRVRTIVNILLSHE